MTFAFIDAILYGNGELSERFKELVLKTSDSERNLGFESLTLRQKSTLRGGFSVFSVVKWEKRRGSCEIQ